MPELDRLDRKILDALQRNGRITMTELGEQIGLSTSPCAERVRRLERDYGVHEVRAAYARLAPAASSR